MAIYKLDKVVQITGDRLYNGFHYLEVKIVKGLDKKARVQAIPSLCLSRSNPAIFPAVRYTYILYVCKFEC